MIINGHSGSGGENDCAGGVGGKEYKWTGQKRWERMVVEVEMDGREEVGGGRNERKGKVGDD